jgi:hypothetical protein
MRALLVAAALAAPLPAAAETNLATAAYLIDAFAEDGPRPTSPVRLYERGGSLAVIVDTTVRQHAFYIKDLNGCAFELRSHLGNPLSATLKYDFDFSDVAPEAISTRSVVSGAKSALVATIPGVRRCAVGTSAPFAAGLKGQATGSCVDVHEVVLPGDGALGRLVAAAERMKARCR